MEGWAALISSRMCMMLKTSRPYLTRGHLSHSPGGRHTYVNLQCGLLDYFVFTGIVSHLKRKHRNIGATSNASSQGPRNTPNTTGAQEVFAHDRGCVGVRWNEHRARLSAK